MREFSAPPKKITVSLRMEEADFEELTKIAQKHPRVKRADVIRAAIKDFLRDNRPQNANDGDKTA